MVKLLLLTMISGGWNLSIDAGLNLTQSYYNDAWQGDEIGAITWAGIVNFDLKRDLTTTVKFSNTGQFSYGQTYNQNPETGDWSEPQKSTDKIENEAIFKITLGWLVDPFFGLRLKSQFFDEANEKFVNPLNFTEVFGVAKNLCKAGKSELNSRLGIAFKETFDRVEGADHPAEGGLELVFDGKKVLSKHQNIPVSSAFLRLFITQGPTSYLMTTGKLLILSLRIC